MLVAGVDKQHNPPTDCGMSPVVAYLVADVFPDCCCLLPCSPEAHEAAVNFTYPMFSQPVTAQEFLDSL
jgi:hypothetical protein